MWSFLDAAATSACTTSSEGGTFLCINTVRKVNKLPNIFEALISVLKTSAEYEHRYPLHTGEATACWLFYTTMKEFIRYEEVGINTTIDPELLGTLRDAKKLCEGQVERMEKFMIQEGIPLPETTPPKPKSNPDEIPLGAKLTDDEIANGLSFKVAAAITNCAAAQAQAIRNDVGVMMLEFQIEMLIFGSSLRNIMRQRGWLKIPPFYQPPGAPEK